MPLRLVLAHALERCLMYHIIFFSSANINCLKTLEGNDYVGQLSTTDDNDVCEHWSKLPAHAWNESMANFPDATIGDAANYCRNPNNNRDGPWCFSSKTNTTKLCNIPSCGKSMDQTNIEQSFYSFSTM